MQGKPRDLTAWGLWYQSADGTTREVRRLRHQRARGDRDEDQAWAAVAAKLAVDGIRTDSTRRDPEPARVVVVEVGLGDGSVSVVADLSPEQARRFYQDVAMPRIKDLIAGVNPRPGRDCGQCRWLAYCPALTSVRGLLGQPGRGAYTRSVSASDLDRYAICPALHYGRDVIYLPPEAAHSSAQQRGSAVHRWLQAAHQRDGHSACTEADLPRPGEGEPACPQVLTAEEYATAWPYLRQHVQHCPLQYDGLDYYQVEQSHYVYDPDADVVLAATPDLTFRAGATPVWREVKTTMRPLPADEEQALETYLAAAVNLVLLAEQVPNGGNGASGPVQGMVELEVLGPDDSRVYVLDATDEALVAKARRLLATAAYEWHTDTTFTPRPSHACTWCPVRRWCPSRDERSTMPTPAPRDVEASLGDDDEVPF